MAPSQWDKITTAFFAHRDRTNFHHAQITRVHQRLPDGCSQFSIPDLQKDLSNAQGLRSFLCGFVETRNMKQHITTLYFLGILCFAFGCTTTGTGSKSVTRRPFRGRGIFPYGQRDLIVLAEPTGPDALQEVYDSRASLLTCSGSHVRRCARRSYFLFRKTYSKSPKSEYVMQLLVQPRQLFYRITRE